MFHYIPPGLVNQVNLIITHRETLPTCFTLIYTIYTINQPYKHYNNGMKYHIDDFEAHYHVLKKPIGIYVFSKVKKVSDAQDIMQNIMMSLFKAMKKGHDIENLLDYTYAIARSELSKFYKITFEEVELFDDDEVVDQHEDLNESTLNHVTEDILWQEIKKFDSLTQRALVMKYKYDMTYSQMEKALKVNASTLKYRVHQAVESLKEKFL
jgi:RNA polymerase sigma factor (sigma-70 family)